MTGKSPRDAPNPTMMPSMFVLDVAALRMALTNALRWSHTVAVTPYKVAAWQDFLM